MSKKDKIVIGLCVWFALGFLFGTYSSFIPNELMSEGVQTYGPYIAVASWIIFMSRWDKKIRNSFFKSEVSTY